jgi:hypothetical protein
MAMSWRRMLRALCYAHLALTLAAVGTVNCAEQSLQLARRAVAAATTLTTGDAVAAWRSLPTVAVGTTPDGQVCARAGVHNAAAAALCRPCPLAAYASRASQVGCPIEEQLHAELHNLVAATAMRVAALSLPPPDLSAESMTTVAAAALSASLQLRPRAAEVNWNAALLAGMAEGATGTWEQTPPLEGAPLLHSAAHGSLFVAGSADDSAEPTNGSARLAECLRCLRRPSAAARAVHGGVLADGGMELGAPSALWAFATTVGRATAQAVLPSDPEARQVLSMLLATDLPADGSAEAEAARIHAQMVSAGALPTPSLGTTAAQFFVAWGVNASLERWRDMASCATVNHQRPAGVDNNTATTVIRGVCRPPWSYLLRMGPTKRGYWWRAHAVPSSPATEKNPVQSYDVRWTADGGMAAALSPVVLVVSSDHRGKEFDSFVRSVDIAAQHARSLSMHLYPSESSQDATRVAIVVQAIPGTPLNQSRWRAELRASLLLEVGMPDAAERLSPTGFLRTVITGSLLSETLDQILHTSRGGGGRNARDPLLVWVSAASTGTMLPIDFFGSLEQHVVRGQQIYSPAGMAVRAEGASESTASSNPMSVPLYSAAPIIGAKLDDMQRAVMQPGMEYWTADGAWVGSEAWALLRSFSHGMGMEIARPLELDLQFTGIDLGNRSRGSESGGAESGGWASWWSAAARTGLCISHGERHHPGLLSRVNLQGVLYHDPGGSLAPAASDEEHSLQLLQSLSREAASRSGDLKGSRCAFRTDSVGRLEGSVTQQAAEAAAAVTPDLRCASLPLGENRPLECRLALLALLRTASDALSASGIIHWLDFGTLLGALRERDIIAHTNDAEIGSLFSKKSDILGMRAGLLDCGVEMHNRAHSNDRNGVGVVDYMELVDQRYVNADGVAEIKLDVTLRAFMHIHRPLVDEVGAPTARVRMLVDPTDNYANTARSAVMPSELLPLQRCDINGVGFPCPKDGIALAKRYYGEDCMEVVRRDVHVATNGDGSKHVNPGSMTRSDEL